MGILNKFLTRVSTLNPRIYFVGDSFNVESFFTKQSAVSVRQYRRRMGYIRDLNERYKSADYVYRKDTIYQKSIL